MRKTFLLSGLLLLLALPASAPGRAPTDSTVTLHYNQADLHGYFFGVVKSDKQRCVTDRTVKVQYSPDNSVFHNYGQPAAAFEDGAWSVSAPNNNAGYYRAIAARKQTPQGTCRKAKSPLFALF